MTLALRLTKWLAPAAALFALVCALLTPAEAGSARQQRSPSQNVRIQPEGKPTPPSVSTVRGRAVYDDTARPVRRARVMLIRHGGGHHEHVALTDARGDFRIDGVSAGSYYAYVDMPGVLAPVGFIRSTAPRTVSGPPDFSEGERFFDRIEVDGRADVNVTVHARRGAIIAGRVSYADGDPAVNVQLSLMRRFADGRIEKQLTLTSAATLSAVRTDDRGMFRVAGLPPGEYLLGVTELIHHGGDSSRVGLMTEDAYISFRSMFTQQLLMTFHPSATSEKEAAVIKVEAGEERADVDITIPERELRTINGIVRARRNGLPVAGANISIALRNDLLAPSGTMAAYLELSEHGLNSTTTDEQGRWQMVEIPDGDYTIHVKPPGKPEYETEQVDSPLPVTSSDAAAPASNANSAAQRTARQRRFYAPTRVDLDVSGSDVSEFVVEVAEGARVTGTISVEGGGKLNYWHVAAVRFGEGGGALEEVGADAAETGDGRFSIEGLPAGRFLIRPTVTSDNEDEDGDENFYLKSINWNGRDLLREPLTLTDGAEVSGVRIVYGRNPATLHVTVRGGAGKRPGEEFIIVFVPADSFKWSVFSQPFHYQPTSEGTCEITLSPGEYHVLALGQQMPPGAYEEETRRRAPTAPRVTLREGETRRIEVDAPADN